LVFASGNQSPAIDYPANSNPNIITVGAIASSGNRSSFSGFGNELDVVAPGSSILSTIPNQGTASWNGTSMAAPHVAGIAALILSVNPDLTVQEVNTIIESTAQKVGGYSYSNNSNRPNGIWNNEMGYGLVDAYAAVQMAQQFTNAELEDIAIVCYNDSKTIQLSNNQNNPVTWQTSSNVTISSSNNNSITVRASYSNSTGNGWVRAVLSNGATLQEDFEVGVPNISNHDITNASRWGTYILNNRVWNRMDISLNSQLAYNLAWDVTATNSLISHSGTQPKFNINPNQNYGYIQIGIKAENQCGCSQWKWKIFSVDGATGGGIGGIIHPE
jgi:hypothetical protein